MLSFIFDKVADMGNLSRSVAVLVEMVSDHLVCYTTIMLIM